MISDDNGPLKAKKSVLMGRGGAIKDGRQKLLKLKSVLESGSYEVDPDSVVMSITVRLLENALEYRKERRCALDDGKN